MALMHLYRPTELQDFENNPELVSSVKAWIKNEDKNHSILITGPSGAGKTTLGRILATELGSYNPELSKAENIDFIEMNSADFGGVDTVRSIRKTMNLAPVQSKNKVYLLDEVHATSSNFQEAMLKLLEDTPSHVFFILATTNPEKLKTTLKRRCIKFHVDPFSDSEMKTFLNEVAEEEEKEVPEKVIKQITQDSLGSPGVALSILDKIITLDKKSMLKAAEQVAIKENQIIDLCRLLLNSKAKWKKVAEILKGIKEEPETVRRSVLGYMNSVLLSSGNTQAYIVMECFSDNFYDSGKAGLTKACFEIFQED